MVNLFFQIDAAEATRFAAAPEIGLQLRIKNTSPGVQIQSVLLQCQVQIEPALRKYTPEEQSALKDLFGEAERWGRTVHSLLWTNASVIVPAFDRETVAAVPLPCTFDFNVAMTKYLYGLENGSVPITILFSGSVFYRTDDSGLQIAKISWDREARFSLPVKTWRGLMDAYYPNTAWMCLRRDVFDRLYRFKTERGIPTWEQAMEQILAETNRLEQTPA